MDPPFQELRSHPAHAGHGCRYDRALEKANAATLEAVQQAAAVSGLGDDDDDDDLRSALDESLQRARRAAAGKGGNKEEGIAQEVIARRLQDEETLRSKGSANDGGAPPLPRPCPAARCVNCRRPAGT